ncbi:MAG: cupin domain-containing protein [Chloroflexaceae bacterium]|nr:cupin domain-containing protein [Chloroflexaceae bacterium]
MKNSTHIIEITRQPGQEALEKLGVFRWPLWTKEVSEFPWIYQEAETCYFLCGAVTVTPAGGGESVTMGQGDLVTFPAGLSCTWRIERDVKKHYRFG